MIIMASASGTPVPSIARLVAAHEDTVRDVIHLFNEIGLRALDPQWAGGRPRRINDDDEAFIVATATTRPAKLGRPFTRWSLRKLADYLATDGDRRVIVGRERLRQLLRDNGVSWQRTRTWKESKDPDFEVKLARIEEVTTRFPQRCFAFDQFGPLSIRPHHGGGWAPRSHPDGAPIYVILDNLSANKTPAIRAWAARNKVELCLTPTSASWANPIEAQFGPLRMFTMANSNHPNHSVLSREMRKYLRWRNANGRRPDVLAAQRRERARVRSERQLRWGRPRTRAA
jgi:transposase